MNLISVAMFALNVNVDGNSRQARVNGRSDCVGVLWSCCGVLCCAVLWCAVDVGVTFFLLIFSRKNALPSMMFAFRSLWPSTMISCFLLLAAVSSTFRDNKPYLFHISTARQHIIARKGEK